MCELFHTLHLFVFDWIPISSFSLTKSLSVLLWWGPYLLIFRGFHKTNPQNRFTTRAFKTRYLILIIHPSLEVSSSIVYLFVCIYFSFLMWHTLLVSLISYSLCISLSDCYNLCSFLLISTALSHVKDILYHSFFIRSCSSVF